MGKLWKLILFTAICVELVTSQHYNCTSDVNCTKFNLCNMKKHDCQHKDLFPLSGDEIIGLVSIAFGSALSNAGGIGGGGLLIPILLILLGFVAHEAIPISKLMIFTGALTSFILGFRQRHPTRDAISIDYNIPLLLVPMLLFGTMVGVTLNKVWPPWLILINLTLILIINTYKTISKGVTLFKKEKLEMAKIDRRTVELSDKTTSVKETKEGDKNVKYRRLEEATESNNTKRKDTNKLDKSADLDGDHKTSPVDTTQGSIKTAVDIELEKDSRKLPMEKIAVMIICYASMLVITFLKGSEHMSSFIGVKACSSTYWLIYAAYFPFAVVVTYFVSKKIQKEYDYRQTIHFPFTENDIRWSTKTFFKLPLYSFISGIMAGLLGIGGGLILGPLLLQLNIHPVVSTATSNFLVLFTSSSTSIQFIIMGMMNFQFGVACTISSSLGSFFGTIIIQKVIEKYKRFSLLVLILGGVLGVSTVMIPIHTFINIIKDVQNDKDVWTFNTPC